MTEIKAFLDIAADQPTWLRTLMMVLGTVTAAALFGAGMALILTLLEWLTPPYRRTVGSWWEDREARADRRLTARTLAEMDQIRHLEEYKRRRLNSDVNLGDRR